jgi:hypothetical protein
MSCVMLVRRPVLGEQLAHLPVDVRAMTRAAERDALVERAADGVKRLRRLPIRRADEDGGVRGVRPGAVDPG